jgi:predicted nucleotidyltransferase component of viral defense system
MIPYLELRSAARTAGVPASTIERDYVQGWFLAGLTWDVLALKGGTAIRKAFIPDYRFSDDLDFTLTTPVKIGTIQSIVDAAVDNAKTAGRIMLEEAKRIEEVQNGFMMALRFRLEGSSYRTVKLKLDFTKSENEQILLPLQTRRLIHKYSDRCTGTLRTYSLAEMVSEKIRSLFQRTRARDLYDIWYLLRSGLVDEGLIRQMVGKKCQMKQLTVDPGQLSGRSSGFRYAWKASLAHQMREVPEFSTVFDWTLSALSGFGGGIRKAP